MLPVIHAGAFKLGVVEPEPEGFDQMKGGLRGGAEAGDVAGVRGNFGFDQDNVHDGGKG
jgi:hypothetical protein